MRTWKHHLPHCLSLLVDKALGILKSDITTLLVKYVTLLFSKWKEPLSGGKMITSSEKWSFFSISFCADNTHGLSPTRNFQASLNKQTTHSWVIPAFEMLARNLQSLVIPSPSKRVKQGLVGLTYNPWPCGTIIRILVTLGMIRGWLRFKPLPSCISHFEWRLAHV